MTAGEARRLRGEEHLSIAQIQQRLGVTKHLLTDWLRGVPAPEWTRRPNAKDDLRARALELRGEGWSVNDIALELGVARSTAWLWVKHLPLDPDSERAKAKREHSKVMTDAQWDRHRAARDALRDRVRAAAAAEVGVLTGRELFLLGAIAYWCEGAKAKPWRPNDCRILFVNSDPVLLALFLSFLDSQGVQRANLSYRVAIHESADATAAVEWWARRLGLPPEQFRRPTLKRHVPRTNRYNTGEEYHGCLTVYAPRSRELYWRIEGIVDGLEGALGIPKAPRGS